MCILLDFMMALSPSASPAGTRYKFVIQTPTKLIGKRAAERTARKAHEK
jgi:hypothetical protein